MSAKKTEDDEGGAKPEGGEGVDLPKKKVSGKKLAIIIAALVILLIAVGAGLYFTGIIGKKAPADGEHAAAEGEHATEGEAEAESEGGHGGGHGEGAGGGPIFVDVPQILINLSTTGRRPTYLRLRVSLELAKEADRTKVTETLPRVLDTFQLYLRELSLDELQGTAGIERLREELRLRVSAAVAPIEIKDVLFSEMIIQSQ